MFQRALLLSLSVISVAACGPLLLKADAGSGREEDAGSIPLDGGALDAGSTPDAGSIEDAGMPAGLEVFWDFETGDAVSGIPNLASDQPLLRVLSGTLLAEAEGRILSTVNDGTTFHVAGSGQPPSDFYQRFGAAFTLEAWSRQVTRNDDDVLFSTGFAALTIDSEFAYCSMTVHEAPPATTFSVYWVGVPATTVSVPIDQWAHLACVYDGSTLTLYVNGSAVQSPRVKNKIGNWVQNPIEVNPPLAALGPLNVSPPIEVGRGPKFVGKVDDLKIWSVARSPSEVCADSGGTSVAGPCFH